MHYPCDNLPAIAEPTATRVIGGAGTNANSIDELQLGATGRTGARRCIVNASGAATAHAAASR